MPRTRHLIAAVAIVGAVLMGSALAAEAPQPTRVEVASEPVVLHTDTDKALLVAPTTTTTVAPPPPPTTTTEAPQSPAEVVPPTSGSSNGDPYDDASWYRLYECESAGLGWSVNTGNGYYGGLQFSLSSWQSVGGSGRPDQATPAEQIARGKALWERGGWAHWPACTAKFGWR